MNLGKAILGLLTVAGASALGAYGSARSSFQPQPPTPGMRDLLRWVLNFNDPLALALVAFAAITAGLSIYQAITSLTKKDVVDVVTIDGELTRQAVDDVAGQLTRDNAKILNALEKLEKNQTPRPTADIDTIIHALKEGRLDAEELKRLRELLLQDVLSAHEPPREVMEALEMEMSRTDAADLFLDSLREFRGESRAKIITERARIVASSREKLSEQYSRLAAFAAIEEPLRAIEFYRQALKLDATNASATTSLGRLLKLYGTTSEAREHYEAALSAADKPFERVNLAVDLADVLLQQGESQVAESVLLEALVIADSEAAADAPDPFWLHKVLSLNNALAGVERRLGQKSLALQRLNNSLAAVGQLDAMGHVCEEKDLNHAATLDCRGLLSATTGDTEAALRDFTDTVDIFRTLVSRYPTNSDHQRGLSIAFLHVSQIDQIRGDLDAANKSLGDALAANSSLLERLPGNKQLSRDRFVIKTRQAELQAAGGDFAAAGVILAEEELRLRALLVEDPRNAEGQRDLSVLLEKVGNIAKADDRMGDALIHFDEARMIREKLLARDEDNLELRRDVAVIKTKIATIYINEGHPNQALEFLTDAQEFYLSRQTALPESADTNFDLYDVTQCIGDALWNSGLRSDALEVYGEAQAMIDTLHSRHPDVAVYVGQAQILSDKIARFHADLSSG